MSVTVILEADVKLGKKEQLLKLLTQCLPETRAYKGFISISVYSEKNENKIILFSKWKTVGEYHNYLQWRTDTGVMDMLAEHLASVPVIRYLNTEIEDDMEHLDGK